MGRISLKRMLLAVASICLTLSYERHEYREARGTTDIVSACLGFCMMAIVGSCGLGAAVGFVTGKWRIGVLVAIVSLIILIVLEVCHILP